MIEPMSDRALLEELRKDLKDIKRVLYEGNGESLTTRMALVERQLQHAGAGLKTRDRLFWDLALVVITVAAITTAHFIFGV